MARVLTATHEYEVHATIEFTSRPILARAVGHFSSIVAAGRTATTLHYEAQRSDSCATACC